MLQKGVDLAIQGEIAEAKAAYANVKMLDPIYFTIMDNRPNHWNVLCRAGALWRKEKDILEACGRAVELAPSLDSYRDSRGIARALIGDRPGAIDDFEFFIAEAKEQNEEMNKEAIQRREEWIAALRAGNNPFDDAMLEALRAELR
jgi:hypothetical protein